MAIELSNVLCFKFGLYIPTEYIFGSKNFLYIYTHFHLVSLNKTLLIDKTNNKFL